jgi:hypothetical protein
MMTNVFVLTPLNCTDLDIILMRGDSVDKIKVSEVVLIVP